jgi:hypothetical protein
VFIHLGSICSACAVSKCMGKLLRAIQIVRRGITKKLLVSDLAVLVLTADVRTTKLLGP